MTSVAYPSFHFIYSSQFVSICLNFNMLLFVVLRQSDAFFLFYSAEHQLQLVVKQKAYKQTHILTYPCSIRFTELPFNGVGVKKKLKSKSVFPTHFLLLGGLTCEILIVTTHSLEIFTEINSDALSICYCREMLVEMTM